MAPVAQVYAKVFKRRLPANIIEKRVVQAANAKFKAWQLADAVAELDAALHEKPGQRSVLHLKADILVRMGKRTEARNITEALLDEDPLDLRAIQRLKAMGCQYNFSPETAEGQLANTSADPKIFLKIAQYLNEGGFSALAAKYANQGARLLTDRSDSGQTETLAALLVQHGVSLQARNLFEEACLVYETVDPRSIGYKKAVAYRAKCLLELGRGADAEAALATIGAYSGGPIAFHGTLFAAFLLQGKIAEAHSLYRARATSLAIAEYFNMPRQPKEIGLLTGAHKDQSALVIAEGGPGDEIRIASTYEAIERCVQSLSISCDPRLHSLLERSFPRITFIPAFRYRKEVLTADIKGRSTLTDRRLYTIVSDDVAKAGRSKGIVCTALDVLAELRADRPSFQRSPSRLTPDPELFAAWSRRMGNGERLQVGLAWRSMLISNDRNRHYLRAEDFEPFRHLKGVDFWVLQTMFTPGELEYLKGILSIRVPDIDLKDDFEGQAALMANLDAVIAPLNTTAELSGMVGTKTLIFCRTHEVSWRKNDDGSDVWYANARLVTGQNLNAPESLIEGLVAELEALQRENPKAAGQAAE